MLPSNKNETAKHVIPMKDILDDQCAAMEETEKTMQPLDKSTR